MRAQADTEEQALAAASLVVLSRESRQRPERKPKRKPEQSPEQSQDMEPLDPEALDEAMKVIKEGIRELKRILGIPQARRPRKRRMELEWECPACIRGTGIHNHLLGPKRRRQKRGGR
tara:strand:- start:579 stop:932 length:354 start_codon:yes stop_codon:yes gene_type:complete